jgi:cellulose synthase operon protein C
MHRVLLALALSILAACGEEPATSAQHLDRAKTYLTRAEYPSAIVELQNALQLDGQSAQARWLLGKLYLETGEILAAEKELRLAQGLGWPDDDIRPALARALLAQGRFADVLALQPQGLKPGAAALLMSSQVMAALSEKQLTRANELVGRALENAPQLLEANLPRAAVSITEGEAAVALAQLDAILADAPNNGEAWWLKGQTLLLQAEPEAARAAFDQSIAHSNVAFVDRIARAMINLQLADYEAAQSDAAYLLKLSPEHPMANYVQGLLDFQNQQYRTAITHLTLAEPVAPQFPKALYYLAGAHLNEKNLDLAEKFGQQYVALAPDDAAGRKLLASVLVLQGKVKDARATLQPVVDNNPDDVAALNILANALLLDDQADVGMAIYARIRQLQPDWNFVPLRLQTAAVQPGPAAGNPSPAAPGDTGSNFPQTEILLILDALAREDFQTAIKVAKDYQFRELQSLAPYRVLGRVYLAAGQPADAREVIANALKREPFDRSSNIVMAQLALAAGDREAARRYYQTLLEKYPTDLSTLLLLASLEASEQNEPALVARLKQAIQAHPTVLEPRLRLAGHYLATGSPEKVSPIFEKLADLQQRSPRVLELTAQAQLAQQQHDKALASLRQWVDADPDSAQARYLIAVVASESGDLPLSKRELQEAVRIDSDHVPSLILLARVASMEGDQPSFEQHLATLAKLAPDIPDVLRLRALSAQANGNAAEALALTQRAYEQAPTTRTVLELASYQNATGDRQAARDTLQQWLRTHPAEVPVHLLLANTMEQSNDTAGAQAQYLAVLEHEPGNITALNNIAWLLRNENPALALDYIRRAVKLAPDRSEVLDTLAVVEQLNAGR